MNWIEFFGFKNFFNWISMGLKFYYNPKKFFKFFFAKPNPEKLAIITCYSVLAISFHTITRNLEWEQIFPYFFFRVILAFQFIVLLYITHLLISKIHKTKKIKFKNISFFIIVVTILVDPIFEALNYAFLQTESLLYSIILMISVELIMFLTFIYSNFIFYKKWKLILSGIFLNIAFINLFIIVRNLNIISSHETNPSHYGNYILFNQAENINNENIVLFEKFPMYDVIPTEKIYVKVDDHIIITYLYRNKNFKYHTDSLKENLDYDLRTRKFIKFLKLKIENVDTVRYKHNRILLSKIKVLYNEIDKEINQFEKDSVIPIYVEKPNIDFKDGIEIFPIKMDNKIISIYNDIVKKQNRYRLMLNVEEIISTPIYLFLYPGLKISTLVDPNDEV